MVRAVKRNSNNKDYEKMWLKPPFILPRLLLLSYRYPL